MLNRTTPLHEIHTSMTCPCAQCQQARNAQTAVLPRFNQPTSADRMLFEVVTAIDSETGKQTTYYWPIHRFTCTK